MPTVSAQVFHGPGRPLKLEHRPHPQTLNAGEVLVAVDLATICGSDLHTLSGQRPERTPCVLGHEAVGRVVTTDGARTGIAAGDRVTWSVADCCGVCDMCADHGLPQKCRSLFKYGHADLDDGTGLNGCYASHIVLRAGTHIVKVPDSLPDDVVAPANCGLATAVNAVSQLPDDCKTVVIQGTGLLGLYACALLHERGVPHVFCVDLEERRLAQAAAFGGIAVNGQAERYTDDREIILSVAEDGVDAVMELSGSAALVPEGIRLLRPGGHYVLAGMVHPHSGLEITGEQIIRKCLTIQGVHNYGPRHLDRAVRFLADTVETCPYHDLVSPPFALADLAEAIEAARSQEWFRVSVRAV